jgi:hypothetical protein
MPLIFTTVKFLTPEEVPKRALFDVYIVDDLQSHKAALADFADASSKTGGTITIVLKSKLKSLIKLSDMVGEGEETQRMSELELLARSGFLSVVGLSNFTLGHTKEPFSLP